MCVYMYTCRDTHTMSLLCYCIAGKFGGELNLPVWQSINLWIHDTSLKCIHCMHLWYVYVCVCRLSNSNQYIHKCACVFLSPNHSEML